MSAATTTTPHQRQQNQTVAHPQRWAALILVAFVMLAFAYSLITPPFETPDEVYHYAFARHLSQGNWLPVQSVEASGPWEHEGSQPPLYYMLSGWLTSWVDQSDFAALAVRNLRANIGDPQFPGNKNFMLYSGAARPLTGSNLALHLGRWFSVALGACTLWLIYLTARLAFARNQQAALLAMALAAGVPQFAFISGAFTNDTLIIMLSAATVFHLARLVAKDNATPVRLGEWIVLGVLLGLAALSKLQGLGLAPLVGGVVLYIGWQRRSWRLPLVALLASALPAMAIAGWWYARNFQLYGDWTGTSTLFTLSGQRADPLDLASWWLEFRGVRYSFWGLFGWFNILLPDWVYWLLDAALLLGLSGALLALLRVAHRAGDEPEKPTQRVRWLLASWLALSFALMVLLMLRATASQGRLLFPALGALSILIALGMEFWLRRLPGWLRAATWTALLGVLFGCSIYVLTVLLPASYSPAPPIAAIPSDAQPVDVTYGTSGSIVLRAIAIAPGRFRAGDEVPITLYFQATEPVVADYQLFVQLLDENGREVANVTTHPGWGRNPTTLWQPGAIYAEHYPVKITGEIDERSPLLARVYTGFVDPATSETTRLPLPAYNTQGERITPLVATVTIAPRSQPTLGSYQLVQVGAEFGDVIALAGSTPTESIQLGAGQPLTITLLWEATGTPATDYTAFVHLLDARGTQIAGFDRAPSSERFPTNAWRSGDRIVSDMLLNLPAQLPAGEYQLWAGLYESGSAGAVLLPVTDGGGRNTGEGQVLLGKLRVHE
jgi:4-amino-4-deoxy-L-arabinose transferase-like glycosyltransferase